MERANRGIPIYNLLDHMRISPHRFVRDYLDAKNINVEYIGRGRVSRQEADKLHQLVVGKPLDDAAISSLSALRPKNRHRSSKA